MDKQFNFNPKKGIITDSTISSIVFNTPIKNNDIIIYQNNNNNWINTGSSTFINNLNINQGPQGSIGNFNLDGYLGFQGNQGINNINGSTGPTGSQGPIGPSFESNLKIGFNYANIVIATGSNTTTYFSDGSTGISIGNNAGVINQNINTIAIGINAGNLNQASGSIAIGWNAAQSNQNENCIAIGDRAGFLNQGKQSIAIGERAGFSNSENSTISIGYLSGFSGIYQNSISIGTSAGCNTGLNSICIGSRAGAINSYNSIMIGLSNGVKGNYTNPYGIMLGTNNCTRNNATGAISIGNTTMQTQSEGAIAIGLQPRTSPTGSFIHSVAIGSNAGGSYIGSIPNSDYSVIIGRGASPRDNSNNVHIGFGAGGNTNQTFKGSNVVSIGNNAGFSSQNNYSIAIGTSAGNDNQGIGAIAIGYLAGQTTQSSNSIIINGNISVAVNIASTGFYISGNVRNVSAGTSNGMAYNPTTREIFYDSTKTFVIDHPLDQNKYLVHACLEGPEAGVYYRGKTEIKENEEYVEIELPNYVEKLATDFTIKITPIGNIPKFLHSSEVENNKFKVYGDKGYFYWYVLGLRKKIDVEVEKLSKELKGNGPYVWL